MSNNRHFEILTKHETAWGLFIGDLLTEVYVSEKSAEQAKSRLMDGAHGKWSVRLITYKPASRAVLSAQRELESSLEPLPG